MKSIKRFLPFIFAGAIALFLVACGGSAAPSGGDSGEPSFAYTEFQNVSGFNITATGGANATQVEDITIEEGEALVCSGVTESGTWEVVITQDGAEISTDELYEGSSVSELGLGAGTYTVSVTAKEATGTVNVLAYPADTIDYMNTETEEIISTIQGYIDGNA